MTGPSPAGRGSPSVADPLALVLLGVIMTVPLASSYRGAGWWLVVALATLGAVGAVGVSLRTRAPALVALGLLVVGYILLGYPLASGDTGAGALVPGPESLPDLARESVRCWGELIGTLPRVDAAGSLLLVPLALCLSGTGAAAMLALLTRRPFAPLVPFVLTLQACSMLGRAGRPQIAEGVVLAVVGLAWATERSSRGRSHRPGLARAVAMGMVLALASTVAAVWVQRAEPAEPVLLRERLAQGADTGAVPTLLTGFRRFTRQPAGEVDNVHDVRLLTVKGAPEGTRMRFSVLDRYDGVEWRPNPDTSPRGTTDRFLRIGSTLDLPASGRAIGVRVRPAKGWRSPWVPTAGMLQSFSFDFRAGAADRGDELTYNPLTRAALLPTRLKPGESYYFTARMVPDDLTAAMTAAQGVDPEQYRRAEFLDPVARSFLRATSSPMEALFAASREYRRKGRYSDGAFGWERRFPSGHGLERLDRLFLRAPQMVGNDEQYAAIVALTAIRMRIPARVVLGAVVPRNGIVEGSRVQAWVEVELADGSWRTLPTERFMGQRPPDRKAQQRRRGQVAIAPPERVRPPAVAPPAEVAPTPRPERPAASPASPRARWWWLLGLLGLVGVVPVLKTLRRLRRRRRGSPTRRVVGGWQEVLDVGRDLGARTGAPRPRPLQAVLVGAPAGLAELADDLAFGPGEPSPSELEAFWEEVERTCRGLRARAPRRRRILAALNPVTLLASARRRRRSRSRG